MKQNPPIFAGTKVGLKRAVSGLVKCLLIPILGADFKLRVKFAPANAVVWSLIFSCCGYLRQGR